MSNTFQNHFGQQFNYLSKICKVGDRSPWSSKSHIPFAYVSIWGGGTGGTPPNPPTSRHPPSPPHNSITHCSALPAQPPPPNARAHPAGPSPAQDAALQRLVRWLLRGGSWPVPSLKASLRGCPGEGSTICEANEQAEQVHQPV